MNVHGPVALRILEHQKERCKIFKENSESCAGLIAYETLIKDLQGMITKPIQSPYVMNHTFPCGHAFYKNCSLPGLRLHMNTKKTLF